MNDFEIFGHWADLAAEVAESVLRDRFYGKVDDATNAVELIERSQEPMDDTVASMEDYKQRENDGSLTAKTDDDLETALDNVEAIHKDRHATRQQHLSMAESRRLVEEAQRGGNVMSMADFRAAKEAEENNHRDYIEEISRSA